ncbi:unnamed protein product [Paramecium primaurelia]|uniref:Uncharacterized protein n=1 Tax=Paramecium primaurelia TaxID=5886 RepID=A0A8S1NCX7_PARPR|nr:unnamed protein product [Paramecium primaurelia]
MIKIEKDICKSSNNTDSILRLCNSYAKIDFQIFKLCSIITHLTQSHQYRSLYINFNMIWQNKYYFKVSKLGKNYISSNSIQVDDSLHVSAQLFSDQGKIENAIQSIDQTISIWIYVLGYEHIKTAKSIYLKGNLYLEVKLLQKIQSKQKNQLFKVWKQILKLWVISHKMLLIVIIHLERLKPIIRIRMNLKNILQNHNKYFKNCMTKVMQTLQLYQIILEDHIKIENSMKEQLNVFNNQQKYILNYVEKFINLANKLRNYADCHKKLGRFKQAFNDY